MFKRISIIMCSCFLAVFFAYNGKHSVEFVPVMAVPVSNKVIVIDAGHGTPDERC